MQKRDFIQTCTIEFLPKLEFDLTKTLRYAEALWTRLTEQGYGGPQQHQPRQHADYYQQLSPELKIGFDQFWIKFNHKQGRNEAAQAWLQINPDNAMMGLIAQAAEAEALRARQPGQVRKMAQGWLSQRRWEDFKAAPTATEQAQQQATQVQLLKADLGGLMQLYEAAPNDQLRAQITTLQNKIDEYQG